MLVELLLSSKVHPDCVVQACEPKQVKKTCKHINAISAKVKKRCLHDDLEHTNTYRKQIV